MFHRPSRCRRGFIIVFGTQTTCTPDAGLSTLMRCPRCRRIARFTGQSHRTWFTLFLAPIFPISPVRRLSMCTLCGVMLEIPIEQLIEQSKSEQHPFMEAIALYNRLRENPTDSAMLYQLMQMYAGMGEPAMAITSARLFPDALEASPRCRELLAHLESASARRA